MPVAYLALVIASAFGDDFGQKIDLTARIREILVNYPPGSTIVKEFLQNADDAGAGVVKFCVDCRSFNSSTLAHDKLAQFQASHLVLPLLLQISGQIACSCKPTRLTILSVRQGPALLVYNDGVFSDEDFDSIQSIGDSKKRGQLAKTGMLA